MSIAHSGFYNTSAPPEVVVKEINDTYEAEQINSYDFYNDYSEANRMATKIKEYDHGYFVIVVS